MLSTKLKEAAGNSADATLYVDDVFSTYLYTGNGSTQTITNGIDLAGKGGLVWIKSRSAATDHKLTDTTRGATKALISSTTAAETTDTTGLTAFSSTGFSLGASSVYNTNAATYVSWTFREAAKFFDVVTWTGNGAGGATVSHNLGIAPGMIIFKATSSAANWFVYHQSLGLNGSLILNGTRANPGYGRVSAVSSSSFTTDGTGNGFGDTYVAYLFAHDTSSTGIIQCGYATAGTNVNLGWEPQYVMMRNPSALANWLIVDSMRGMPVGSAAKGLLANTSDAESDWGGYVVPNATGFTIGTDGIYMAIRMPNKPPTSGTQVFAPYKQSGGIVNPIPSGFPVDLAFCTETIVYSRWELDRLRGGSSYIATNSTDAESTAGYTLIGFDNNTAINDNFISDSRGVYWMFKRAPGFFDEVCYTGTGSATTQAHNLTVVPEMMITKQRSGTNNWFTYHASIGATGWVALNLPNPSTSSSVVWNDTAPTSTVFTVGTASNNTSGATLVAYLFATLAGISKVGSYTGNGTGQAIACGFSAGARFVLIKRTDNTGDWYTFDSARGLTSGSSPYLLLNSTAAEVTGNNGVYASTGGFTLGATAITTTNIVGASYIFLAVS